MALNRITVIGRLTYDPELRKTTSGTSVTNFCVAVDRDFKDANGDKKTDFFQCIAWRGTAELVTKYLAKGNLACVTGSMQQREYTDRNGNNVQAWEIQAQEVYFLSQKNSAGGSEQDPRYELERRVADNFSELEEADDGDLPF